MYIGEIVFIGHVWQSNSWRQDFSFPLSLRKLAFYVQFQIFEDLACSKFSMWRFFQVGVFLIGDENPQMEGGVQSSNVKIPHLLSNVNSHCTNLLWENSYSRRSEESSLVTKRDVQH